MGQTRPAAVAGSFYPSDPRKLADTVDTLLEAVADVAPAGRRASPWSCRTRATSTPRPWRPAPTLG